MLRGCMVIIGVLGLAFCGVGAASAQYYDVTDLGTLGGTSSYAMGVNSNGQVVGYSTDAGGTYRAFEYSGGSISDIGSPFDAAHRTYAFAINRSGEVAGYARTVNTTVWGNGFIDNGGSYTAINSAPGAANGNKNDPYGINNNGAMAGTYVDPVTVYLHAYLYSGGSTIDLNSAAFYNTKGYALNNSNVVVGEGMVSGSIDPSNHSFVWDSTGGMRALLPGNPTSDAYAINDSNQAVGDFVLNGNIQGPAHAFLCTVGGAALTDLGAVGSDGYSAAYSVNSTGQVVGYSAATWDTQANPRAFLWSSAAGMKDLNTMLVPGSGWNLQYARAIADNGDIAGYGTNASGATHAFLLKPVLAGDANLDGTVDIADLSVVLTNYDKSGMSWGQGDFDQSGTVDINDLSKVLTNYDKSAAASAGIKAVPEPSSLMLVGFAVCGLLAWARRNWRMKPER